MASEGAPDKVALRAKPTAHTETRKHERDTHEEGTRAAKLDRGEHWSITTQRWNVSSFKMCKADPAVMELRRADQSHIAHICIVSAPANLTLLSYILYCADLAGVQ